jgi:hypothetical protein
MSSFGSGRPIDNSQGTVSVVRPSGWQMLELPGGVRRAQFLPSSDVFQLPLRQIDGMPTTEYLATLKDKILDAVEYDFFDTRICTAATTLTANQYRFFNIAQGGTENTLDGGTSITTKTPEYTNAIESGKVEGGNTLIVDSFQVSVFMTHRDFNALTANTGLPSTGAPSGTDTNSATNSLLAWAYGSYFTFSEPNRGIWCEGNPLTFPSDEVLTGSFGGSTPEGWVQVGAGRPRYLRYVRVLQSLHHFDCIMNVYRTITMPLQLIIRVKLCGLKLVS